MQDSVVFQASEMSAEQRLAVETLLGRALVGDIIVSIRASEGRILKHPLTGEALEAAYGRLFKSMDQMAEAVKGVPEDEINAAIDEAVEYVRSHPE